jgi:hypothetical protein
MPLVLGMKLDKDNEIWINDTKVTLDLIKSPSKTNITVHTKTMDHKFTIDNQGFQEIAPNVKMMLGEDTNKDEFCRVLVDAPKSIRIERGARYHALTHE